MCVAIGLLIVAIIMLTPLGIGWRRRHKTKIYRGMHRCAREAYVQYNLVTLCPTVKSGTFIRSTEDVHLERDIIQDYEMRGQKFQ